MSVKRAAIAIAAVALSACAMYQQYQLVPASPQTVVNAISVTPTRAWNRVRPPDWDGRIEMWSLHGSALDALVFIVAVPDGETLLRPKADAGAGVDAAFAFRPGVTAIEIGELFRATLIRNFRTPLVTIRNVRPATVGGTPGFRFETVLVGRDEVERRGSAAGAVRNGRLYLLWYEAARIHYYESYLPDFEAVVASLRFVD